MWNTWESLPIRVERIPDVPVPVETDSTFAKHVVRMKREIYEIASRCSQETSYLNQCLPDLANGKFESYL
jgi:hypothetical protein